MGGQTSIPKISSRGANVHLQNKHWGANVHTKKKLWRANVQVTFSTGGQMSIYIFFFIGGQMSWGGKRPETYFSSIPRPIDLKLGRKHLGDL